MDRRDTESLAQFCIAQRDAFVADDWLARGSADVKAVAFAAKYLSMTSWYGHEEELEHIAATLCPPAGNKAGLHTESQAIDFDWSHFSTAVRIGIALAQVERMSPRAHGKPERPTARSDPG